MTSHQQDQMSVLFVSGLDGDTRRYRCFHHQEQLELVGVDTAFRESEDPQLLVDVLEYDLFILHRVPYNELVGILIDIAHRRGKPVIFETDDLVLEPELYDQIGFVDTLSDEDARQYRDDLYRLAETFERSDAVLTTTEFLANWVQKRGKPVTVHRNAPSDEMIRISERALAAQRERESEAGDESLLTIAYFSGTGSHNRDFRVVSEALIWALEAYPQIQLHIGGQLELEPVFDPFETRIRRAPYVSWRELPHLIAQVDVNLAPLELDNPFCRAKSEIKFVEAALVGVPTIASPVAAYELAITHGENGLLAASTEEWKGALQELIENPERRRGLGEMARRTAYARYLPEQRAPELLAALQKMVEAFGSETARPEPILRDMAALFRDYAAEIRAQKSAQEAQLASLRQVIDQYERQFEHKRQLLTGRIERLERHLEEIQQGRVMRLMNSLDRLFGKVERE